jgi:hypothetical protein
MYQNQFVAIVKIFVPEMIILLMSTQTGLKNALPLILCNFSEAPSEQKWAVKHCSVPHLPLHQFETLNWLKNPTKKSVYIIAA